MSEFLENQFYPTGMAYALKSALSDDLFANLSEANKLSVFDLLISGVQNRVFAHNGLVSFKQYRRWSDAEPREAFIFYPLSAGNRHVALAAMTKDQSPEIFFKEGDNGSSLLESRFEAIFVADATRKIVLKRKKERFEPYDAEKNPIVEVTKRVDAYDRIVAELPIVTRSNGPDDPSVGLRSYVRQSKKTIRLDRRTLSYRDVREIVRAVVASNLEGASHEIARVEIFKKLSRFETKISAALRSDMMSRFEEGWQTFRDTLNVDALELMDKMGLARMGVYHHLKAAPNKQAMQFRAYAFQAYARMGLEDHLLWTREKVVSKIPEPAQAIDDRDDDDWRRDRNRDEETREVIPFWDKIDSGLQALEALKMYDQDTADWRRITRLPVAPPKKMAQKLFDDSAELSVFSSLATILNPKSATDWHSLKLFHQEVSTLYDVRDHGGAPDQKEIIDFIRRAWKGPNEKPTTWADFYKNSIGGWGVCNEINDTLRSLEEYVLGPVLARAGDGRADLKVAFRGRILGRYNMNHLRAASEYWHSDRVRFQARLSSFVIDSNQEWTPLVMGVTSPSGISFHCLTSKPQLKEEGDAMIHCVWSYTENCTLGSSHIISLRNADRRRLSTLELTEVMGGRVAIAQHEAYKRATPSAESQQAAKWLVEEINSGRIQPDFVKIREGRAEFKKQQASHRLGFDVGDLSKCEDVFALYHACLPPRVRERVNCIADFFKEIGFDEDLRKEGIEAPTFPRPNEPSQLRGPTADRRQPKTDEPPVP